MGAIWLLGPRKQLVLLAPRRRGPTYNPASWRRVLLLFQPQVNLLNSTAHRATLARRRMGMIKAHPLVGVGPEQAKNRFYDYVPSSVQLPLPHEWSTQHLHNLYYHYAAERGLPALAALLWF